MAREAAKQRRHRAVDELPGGHSSLSKSPTVARDVSHRTLTFRIVPIAPRPLSSRRLQKCIPWLRALAS